MEGGRDLENKLKSALDTISALSESVKSLSKNVRDDELHRKLDELLRRRDTEPDIMELKKEVSYGNHEIDLLKKQMNLLVLGSQKLEEKTDRISERVTHLLNCQQVLTKEMEEIGAFKQTMEEKMEQMREKIGKIPADIGNLQEIGEIIDTVQTIRGYLEHFSQEHGDLEQKMDEFKTDISSTLGDIKMQNVEKHGQLENQLITITADLDKMAWNLNEVPKIRENVSSFTSDMERIEREIDEKINVIVTNFTEAEARSSRNETTASQNLAALKAEVKDDIKKVNDKVNKVAVIRFCCNCRAVLRKLAPTDKIGVSCGCGQFNVVDRAYYNEKWVVMKCGWGVFHYQKVPISTKMEDKFTCQTCKKEGTIEDARVALF